jgi:hypothetical protein
MGDRYSFDPATAALLESLEQQTQVTNQKAKQLDSGR